MWLNNSPCPKCGSKDNRGVWDDGSTWCWGCHAYTPPTSTVDAIRARLKRKAAPSKGGVVLPDDAFGILPKHALEWLGKYQLLMEELREQPFLYSQSKDLLIFPFYDSEKNLIAWQGRYFGSNKEHPKYISEGGKDMLAIFPNKSGSKTVSVVEDIISAIKVSRVTDAYALLGSFLSRSNAMRLSRQYERMIIWLDHNKAKEALRFKELYNALFEKGVSVVVTPNDPKEYSTSEIMEKLQ